jgi:hypothetical protein
VISIPANVAEGWCRKVDKCHFPTSVPSRQVSLPGKNQE